MVLNKRFHLNWNVRTMTYQAVIKNFSKIIHFFSCARAESFADLREINMGKYTPGQKNSDTFLILSVVNDLYGGGSKLSN